MAKDRRLSELPGISPASVVALERVGFLSCNDLVAADFDRVAYVLDDYTEATRLLREARRICGGGGKESNDPLPPGPLGSSVGIRMPRNMSKTAGSTPTDGAPMDLSSVMGTLALGLNAAEVEDRENLKRRLLAMAWLLEQKVGEPELLAASMIEAVEAGVLDTSEVTQQFGKPIAKLIDQCTTLRALPVLPSGKLPKSFFDNAKSAPREARHVCAAHVIAQAASGGSDGHYLNLHLQALQAGPADDIVEAAAAAVQSGRKAA